MTGTLARRTLDRLRAMFVRRPADRGVSGDPAEIQRMRAVQLARAVDRALELGIPEQAHRLADGATALAMKHARLNERLARLRLAEGEPGAALGVIDCCRTSSESLRMLKAVCLLLSGARAEAHLELERLARRSSAPLQARRLLAHLDWEAGDADAARRALVRNLKHMEDQEALALLVLMHVSDGNVDQAARWAMRLWSAALGGRSEPRVRLLLSSLGLDHHINDLAPGHAQEDILTTELIACEQAIPALVEAQRREPQAVRTRLLARALERALSDLDDQAAAVEGLVQLALVLDDLTAARRWARHGFTLNPMSATFARVIRETEPPEPEAGTAPEKGRAA